MEEKIKYWDYNKQEYRLRKKPTRKPTLEEQLDECKEFASIYERELLAIIKFKDIEITKLKEQINKIHNVVKGFDNNKNIPYGVVKYDISSIYELSKIESNKED